MTAASIKLGEGTPPSSAPGQGVLYFDDSDSQLYVIDAAGNTVGPITGGGGGTNATQLQGYEVGITAPNAGEVLTWDNLASEWLPAAPTGGAPSGVAGGDLGGNYPNPDVVGLQGNAVSATAPTPGQVLAWDGVASEWVPTTPAVSGGSLQDAYDAGRTVVVSVAGGGSVALSTLDGPTPLTVNNDQPGGRGINVELSGSTTGAGIRVSNKGSGNVVDLEQSGAGFGLVVTGGADVTRVNGGRVQTPVVEFGFGGSRVEIIGDPGAGSHYNPQVRITSGPQALGALARCSSLLLNPAVAAQDLTLEPSRPTFVEVVSDPGAGTTLTLPSSADYPRGTELTILHIFGPGLTLASPPGPTVSSIISVTGGVVPAVPVAVNTGIKLVSRLFGWTITGTF